MWPSQGHGDSCFRRNPVPDHWTPAYAGVTTGRPPPHSQCPRQRRAVGVTRERPARGCGERHRPPGLSQHGQRAGVHLPGSCEIVTPGGLPAGLREEDLGTKSVPRNPLLFSMLYRMKLVEQIGSGIRRIRDACLQHGVAQPAIQVSHDWVTVTFPRPVETATPHVSPHVTPHVPPHVERLIAVMQGDMRRAELMEVLGLADRGHYQNLPATQH